MLKSVLLMFFALVLGCLSSKAQSGDYYYTSQGLPMHENTYTDVSGTPYVYDTWLPGKATTDKGKVFGGELKMKYNVYDDQLIFVYNANDQPLLFAEPIKSFELLTPKPLTFVNGFPAIDKQTPKTYYQAIALGKVCILKKYVKNVIETKGYNSSVVEKKFTDDVAYYIYKDNKITSFRKSKDAVLEATADKNPQIADYLKTNNINFKKDDDLTRLFNYYNSL